MKIQKVQTREVEKNLTARILIFPQRSAERTKERAREKNEKKKGVEKTSFSFIFFTVHAVTRQ